MSAASLTSLSRSFFAADAASSGDFSFFSSFDDSSPVFDDCAGMSASSSGVATSEGDF